MRYDATLGVHMQVQLHRTSTSLRSQVPGGAGEVPVQACLDRFGTGTGRLERVQAVRTSSCGNAGRDARWIWPTGAWSPCSCPAQHGRRAATAIPAVTAWKWPACLRGRWRCATRSVPATRSWSSPGPNGRRSLPPSERCPPAYRYPRHASGLTSRRSASDLGRHCPGPRHPGWPLSLPGWRGPGATRAGCGSCRGEFRASPQTCSTSARHSTDSAAINRDKPLAGSGQSRDKCCRRLTSGRPWRWSGCLRRSAGRPRPRSAGKPRILSRATVTRAGRRGGGRRGGKKRP
jgi:hypothetical protein